MPAETGDPKVRHAGEPYMALVREFPLWPIGSEAELDAAIAMIDSLSDRKSELIDQERAYMLVLAKLIEAYEDEHEPAPDVTGASMLAHIIESRGETQAEVATRSGIPESTLSEIIRGRRKLNTKHITALARYFKVDPGLFLE